MRIGLIASAFVHLLIAAWLLRGLPLTTKLEPFEVVPVDLVQLDKVEKPKTPGAQTPDVTQATPAAPKANAAPAGDKSQNAGKTFLTPDEVAAAVGLGGAPQMGVGDIAALIGGRGQSDSGGVATSSLAAGLSRQQIDTLRAQVQRCWKIPGGWTNPRQVSVAIRFRLKRDGTVDGTPIITEFPASPVGKAAADTAVLAIQRCGPYQLPADSYANWRQVELRLAPG